MHLNIFVSNQCFLYCKGCYSFSRTNNCQITIPSNTIVEFLKYAYQRGVKTVTLCGGDPLMRQDIIKLLQLIKELGYSIYLDTVGTTIIKNVEFTRNNIIPKIDTKILVNLVDKIGIPIDGSNNEIFKKFRQTNIDLLSEQLSICEEINKYGGNVCINTVAHKENLEDAKRLSKLINKLDYISKWQIFRYAPLGKYGIMNRGLFEISQEEFEKFKNDVLSTIKDVHKVEFKDYDVRNKAYMMIDNMGDAWIPSYETKEFNNDNLKIEKRKIIGNINDQKTWENICEQLKTVRRCNNET